MKHQRIGMHALTDFQTRFPRPSRLTRRRFAHALKSFLALWLSTSVSTASELSAILSKVPRLPAVERPANEVGDFALSCDLQGRAGDQFDATHGIAVELDQEANPDGSEASAEEESAQYSESPWIPRQLEPTRIDRRTTLSVWPGPSGLITAIRVGEDRLEIVTPITTAPSAEDWMVVNLNGASRQLRWNRSSGGISALIAAIETLKGELHDADGFALGVRALVDRANEGGFVVQHGSECAGPCIACFAGGFMIAASIGALLACPAGGVGCAAAAGLRHVGVLMATGGSCGLCGDCLGNGRSETYDCPRGTIRCGNNDCCEDPGCPPGYHSCGDDQFCCPNVGCADCAPCSTKCQCGCS